jgi:hypothetical protein
MCSWILAHSARAWRASLGRLSGVRFGSIEAFALCSANQRGSGATTLQILRSQIDRNTQLFVRVGLEHLSLRNHIYRFEG